MAVLGIVGTGTIGASIGLRARQGGATVVGYDLDPGAARRAAQLGAIERAVERDELFARAQTIVLAPHLEATLAQIAALAAEPPSRAELILDVASVKEPVARAGERLPNFVATHPMAGSERSGPEAARAELFEGRTWLFVPPADPLLAQRVRAFIAAMGALAHEVGAAEHDRIAALTSHAPQLLAFAFARRVRELGPAVAPFCGPVARELLRLGDSNPAMWEQIAGANRANVERELGALWEALHER
ncbi:MAG TPA: prephenate dehydrogenase/arogenate dehydrogenase family protein [Verrucomicrobiae bacterium]|nr:prephenate dehydrogenase/arogenate dehydrogenase family protein [Verrucomicrobiae bacterium]